MTDGAEVTEDLICRRQMRERAYGLAELILEGAVQKGPADIICIGQTLFKLYGESAGKRMCVLAAERKSSKYTAQEVVAARGKSDPESNQPGQDTGRFGIFFFPEKDTAAGHTLSGCREHQIIWSCRPGSRGKQQTEPTVVRAFDGHADLTVKCGGRRAGRYRDKPGPIDVYRPVSEDG